jgi:mannose-1-phosphate guanylyltransferase/mannose-6-phosphate isomerase
MPRAQRLPVYAVILAGGSGTRLWPLASDTRPKQFLTLFGGRSLFQRTAARAAAIAGWDRTIVVAGRRHASLLREQAPRVSPARTILEGEGRNTAASVALGARLALSRQGDGILVVLPSDHWIAPPSGFHRTLRAAVEEVRRRPVLATIGVRAASPETGFGYIRPARRSRPAVPVAVEAFVEKPGAATARRMVCSGRWLWNSGIFVWRASTILAALAGHAPALARAAASAPLRRGPGGWVVGAGAMARIPAAPIDRAVLEKTRRLVVVPAGFGWSDLGNWNAVAALLAAQPWGGRARGAGLAIDARRCEAINPGGLTVFVGVDDVVAVRSGGALLVCHRGAVQRVRAIPGLVGA